MRKLRRRGGTARCLGIERREGADLPFTTRDCLGAQIDHSRCRDVAGFEPPRQRERRQDGLVGATGED